MDEYLSLMNEYFSLESGYLPHSIGGRYPKNIDYRTNAQTVRQQENYAKHTTGGAAGKGSGMGMVSKMGSQMMS